MFPAHEFSTNELARRQSGGGRVAPVWIIVAISVSGRDNYQHRIYCRHQGRSSRGVCEETGLVGEWKHGTEVRSTESMK